MLKFVFKEMILTEGELTYELNFPFNEFEKAYFYEKGSKFLQGSQNEENQGLEDNKTDENGKLLLKIKELRQKTQLFSSLADQGL